jgi:uncharacterized protein YceK
VRRLLLCLILPVMNGCATVSTVPVSVNSYCSIARPIGYDSLLDTSETRKAIEDHNSQWVCLCEQDCPASVPDTK